MENREAVPFHSPGSRTSPWVLVQAHAENREAVPQGFRSDKRCHAFRFIVEAICAPKRKGLRPSNKGV